MTKEENVGGLFLLGLLDKGLAEDTANGIISAFLPVFIEANEGIGEIEAVDVLKRYALTLP